MYALDPAMPVLMRPDGAVQVGWDPRRAVVVRPPAGHTSAGLLSVLRALSSPQSRKQLQKLALRGGLDDKAIDELLESLTSRGVVRAQSTSRGRMLAIRVHGAGPLSTLVADGLRCSDARVSESSYGNSSGAAAGVDLVVLADALATDPRLLRDLHTAQVPHLPVRVRDGTGLVGPLVIPGVTSCLSCADLHRTDRDPAWPALAAQLRHEVGNADRPTLLATAALALAQLMHVIAGVRATQASSPPATLNTTWEVDVASNAISARRWPRHPLCGCWNSRLPAAGRRG